jgi:hypothetical protein
MARYQSTRSHTPDKAVVPSPWQATTRPGCLRQRARDVVAVRQSRRNALAVNVIRVLVVVSARRSVAGGNDQESVRKHGRVTSHARRSSAAPGAHPARPLPRQFGRIPPRPTHAPGAAYAKYTATCAFSICPGAAVLALHLDSVRALLHVPGFIDHPDRIGHHPRPPQQRQRLAPSARRGTRRQLACCMAVAAPPGARSA